MKRPVASDMKQRTIAEQYWEEGSHGLRLIASRCIECGQHHLPAVAICGSCGAARFERAPLQDGGTIYAFTINHVPAPGFPLPLAVGYVDYPEGVRVFGQFRIPEDGIRVGDRVSVEKAVLKRATDGVETVGYRFVPLRLA